MPRINMWERAHLKIVSDGSAIGTQIIDLKTNEPIDLVSEVSVELTISPTKEPTVMTMRVHCPRVEVTGFFHPTNLVINSEEYEVRYVRKVPVRLPENDNLGYTWENLPGKPDS